MDNPLTATYNPGREFQVKVHDVEYRRDEKQSWQARIYQPVGDGPFPAIVDVHGGAWNGGSRTNNELIDNALARSGIVVAALDFRVAPADPFPAQVIDVNYGTRWFKAHASDFKADANSVGALGSSSGGHTVILNAMRYADSRYASLRLDHGHKVDAKVLYLISAWGVIDPYVRYLHAKRMGRERLMKASEAYFLNEETMLEANPQQILERGEKVYLPPVLLIQGTGDDNVPMTIPENFAKAFRAAGGEVKFEIFPGMPHGFAGDPGPESDRAIESMKAFIARQLAKVGALSKS